jgi:hypothetical protein
MFLTNPLNLAPQNATAALPMQRRRAEEMKTKHQAVRQGARPFGMRSILASM